MKILCNSGSYNPAGCHLSSMLCGARCMWPPTGMICYHASHHDNPPPAPTCQSPSFVFRCVPARLSDWHVMSAPYNGSNFLCFSWILCTYFLPIHFPNSSRSQYFGLVESGISMRSWNWSWNAFSIFRNTSGYAIIVKSGSNIFQQIGDCRSAEPGIFHTNPAFYCKVKVHNNTVNSWIFFMLDIKYRPYTIFTCISGV